MDIYELILDEESEEVGIQAISIVENPAMESDFVALSEEKRVELAKVNEDEQILMGAALIPNKPIYRKDGDKEFYIFFSEDTVKKASQLFFKNSNQSNATLEHQQPIQGMTIVESWIVEDVDMDKSKKYGLNVPVGTWMISMKVDDNNIWQNEIKGNKVFGFSIEGIFADKLRKKNYKQADLSDQQIEVLLETITGLVTSYAGEKKNDIVAKKHGNEVELKTYNDYPQSAVNNAKKVLEWREKYGSEVKGMTRVGWTRASQLARRANLSRSTIARMASFKRHEKNAAVDPKYASTPWKDKGRVAWLGWGGSSGVNWAIRKLESIDKKKK